MKIIFCLLFLLSNTIWAKINIHGHRGARARLPENTLEGFKYAMGLGIEVLELDLAISKDRQVIIAHDPVVNTDLCRYPQKDIPFYSLSLKDIQKIDCGSIPHPRFPRQSQVPKAKIPTLNELFEMVKNSSAPMAKTIQFNIEIKIFPQYPELTPTAKEFARLVYDCIKRHRMIERTIVQSFDYRPLVAIKALDPKVRTSFLNYESLPNFVSIARDLQVDYISPNLDWITKEQVTQLNAIGVKTVPWTANTMEQWDKLTEMGVDGIITDDPEGLLKYLRERGLRQ